MATQYDPIAKDGSLNTTEQSPRNIADVLAEELEGIKNAIGGGGGSGGHTIISPDGTSMTQRAGLGFTDAHISDDAVNDETVVEIVEGISKTDWDNLDPTDPSNNGLYEITDPNDTPILDDTQVAHGNSTVNALLNQIGCLSGLRFKNLGNLFTAEQATALANGDFSGFWNGDYWNDTTQGIIWRIVDNTGIARRKGGTTFDSPSLVVMPDDPLSFDGMNDSGTTANGYNGTKYRSTHRSACKTKFENFFGASHIATHEEVLSNSVSGGQAVGFAFYSCDVEIPTEVNIYGHSVWSSAQTGCGGANIGTEWGRFRLYELAPYMAIHQTNDYFLRDVVSDSWFACMSHYGHADRAGASSSNAGLRPYGIIV